MQVMIENRKYLNNSTEIILPPATIFDNKIWKNFQLLSDPIIVFQCEKNNDKLSFR